MQTELFITFPPPALTSITLIPLNSPETGGRFRVWLSSASAPDKPTLVWDRKVEGSFPELKVLVGTLTCFLYCPPNEFHFRNNASAMSYNLEPRSVTLIKSQLTNLPNTYTLQPVELS